MKLISRTKEFVTLKTFIFLTGLIALQIFLLNTVSVLYPSIKAVVHQLASEVDTVPFYWKKFQIDQLLAVWLLSFFLLVLATIAYILINRFKHYQEKYHYLSEEHDFLIHNTKRLTHQLYKNEPYPRFNFKKIDYACYVQENGDGLVEQVHTLECDSHESTHFWRFFIQADKGTKALDNIYDLNLQIESLEIEGQDDETDVAVLITSNQEYLKHFAVFFLPEVKPGETRKISIKYQWPGFMKKLLEEGATTYTLRYDNHKKDIETDMRFRIFFPKSLGNIRCLNSGSRIDSTKLKKKPWNGDGTLWEYHNPEAKIAGRQIELSFYTDDNKTRLC